MSSVFMHISMALDWQVYTFKIKSLHISNVLYNCYIVMYFRFVTVVYSDAMYSRRWAKNFGYLFDHIFSDL